MRATQNTSECKSVAQSAAMELYSNTLVTVDDLATKPERKSNTANLYTHVDFEFDKYSFLYKMGENLLNHLDKNHDSRFQQHDSQLRRVENDRTNSQES